MTQANNQSTAPRGCRECAALAYHNIGCSLYRKPGEPLESGCVKDSERVPAEPVGEQKPMSELSDREGEPELPPNYFTKMGASMFSVPDAVPQSGKAQHEFVAWASGPDLCACGQPHSAPIHQTPPAESPENKLMNFILDNNYDDEDVEVYITNLPWSGKETDFERTLVTANIRTFWQHVKKVSAAVHTAASSTPDAHQTPPAPAAESTQIVVFILKLIEIDVNFSLKWNCHTKRWQLEIGWLGVDVNDKSLVAVLELAVNEAKTRSEKFKESLHG